MQNDPKFVADGKITPDGLAELNAAHAAHGSHRIRKRSPGRQGTGSGDGGHDHELRGIEVEWMKKKCGC